MPDNEQNPKIISFEDGEVSLNGEVLPGIITSLRVSGQVRFDEQQVDGQSGKSKTPQGFEDADISLELVLLTDSETDCYEKLEALNRTFRNLDGKANPQVFTVASRHLSARGVRQAVFSRLDTTESEGNDWISASLAFVEHNPPVVRLEKAQAKTPTPKEIADAAAARIAGVLGVDTGAVNAEAEKTIEVDLN